MTLTDFLLARLAEDEWEAERALSTLTNEINHARLLNLTSTRGDLGGAPIRRMFAEVEAKRQIVELAAMTERPQRLMDRLTFPTANAALHAALRLIAAVYVDHADYQEEWKP